MNLFQKADICFHEKDRLSVIHSSEAISDKDEQFGEIALTIYSIMKVLGKGSSAIHTQGTSPSTTIPVIFRVVNVVAAMRPCGQRTYDCVD